MEREQRFARYRELQAYVDWTQLDADRIQSIAPLVLPTIPAVVDDFYEEILKHPRASRVLTEGQKQIDRLKQTLQRWVEELFSGRYDADYVERRWRVGLRHVEIGLDAVYTNVAMSRIRLRLLESLHAAGRRSGVFLGDAARSLNKLLDLDLAIIEDAYQTDLLARLQRTERLAAIGQVAGGVAHELRNPLNVMKTSVYYLLHARNPTPEKRVEHLERIERHTELADGVISALSNFAKIQMPVVASFEAREAVIAALESNPLPAEVVVELTGLDDLPLTSGDSIQIQIVLGNLIRNARDAMPTGGRLRISGQVESSRVLLTVEDSGIGIAPDQIGHIMEPLYSTKVRGLGLGLALSRSIIERNQGELRVRSELGQGSAFSICLPLATVPYDHDR
jgi:signal transduction histidine kinase